MAIMVNTKCSFVFLFMLTCGVIMAHSHIAEFDDYWKSRAEEARKDALQAYSPHPHEVTDQLNYDVQE